MSLNHWDLVARLYDYVIHPPDPEKLLRLLQPSSGQRILDIGGGTGRISQLLGHDLDVIVCDPSSAMLGQAQNKGIRACVGMAERLPFADHSFPRIIVVDALHHFLDANLAADELLRVLRSGGRLVIEEPDIREFRVKLVALAERLALMRSRMLSLPDMVSLFKAHGAIVLATDEHRDYNVRLVLSRPESQ